MSAVNAIFAQSESCILGSGHSDDFTVLSGAAIGRVFTARIDVEPVIDPDMPLGSDPRMSNALRIMDGPTLKLGDVFRTAEGTRYKVLRLLDNNAQSITVDYLVEQQL